MLARGPSSGGTAGTRVLGLFAAIGLAMLVWPQHRYDGPPDGGG